MGRLFWKFFLTFWLALLMAGAGVGTAVWVRHNVEQGSAENKGRQTIAFEQASALLALAESAIRYGGIEELRNFLDKSAEPLLPPIYAVDDQDKEVLQREVDPEILQQARDLIIQDSNSETVRLVSADDGHRYLLFIPMHGHGFLGPPPPHPDFAGHPPPMLGQESADGFPFQPPRHGPGPQPPSPLWPILAGIFASLIFSAALAWYFAKPIRHLRNAFDALSHGKLDTRVGASMGLRRDELADLGRDFDDMAGQIHSLVHAQQRLLHDVSHELRSPLARIQAAIGLAQQSPEKQLTMLERIEHESQRMNNLVGELLMLSRLEAGVSGYESQELDIGELLDSIVEDVRFEAEQQQVKICYDGIGETLVNGRGELLHRAFENVLRNAIRHCKSGGEVLVSAWFVEETRLLRVTIADEGPGVAESDLTAIFEPFFRSGDRSKADSFGLGLAIAFRSIEAHRGTIQAHNRPQGGGLNMEITIPFTD